MIKARSAKAKGTRLERRIVAIFEELGLQARKQPLSGALQDWPHDVSVRLPDGDLIVEAKARAEGHRTLDKWLGKADLLVICADRSAPNFYVPERTMRRLLGLIVK